MPSFRAFLNWLDHQGYPYFNFRSVMGPMEDAEQWFDDELKQFWRDKGAWKISEAFGTARVGGLR